MCKQNVKNYCKKFFEITNSKNKCNSDVIEQNSSDAYAHDKFNFVKKNWVGCDAIKKAWIQE